MFAALQKKGCFEQGAYAPFFGEINMEERAVYSVDRNGVLPDTLEAFKNHPTARPYSDAQFRLPTPAEFYRLKEIVGWSQTQIAKMVGVSYDGKKGSAMVRKWGTDVSNKEHRSIPYAAWRLLLLYAGVVSVDDGLCAVKNSRESV